MVKLASSLDLLDLWNILRVEEHFNAEDAESFAKERREGFPSHTFADTSASASLECSCSTDKLSAAASASAISCILLCVYPA